MSGTVSEVDVAIIGGGLVGATLACALIETDLSIVIIDPEDQRKISFATEHDMRVSAITRASQHIFASIGAWAGMVEQRVSPFRKMHVWEQAGEGVLNSEVHFDSAELSESQLGHIIENRVMLKSLYQRLETATNVELLFGQRCQQMQQTEHKWQLQTATRTVSANLLVGADGSQSWVRQQLGISTRGWDYDHSALVTTVKTSEPHQHTAWQRFLDSGPLAFLPLQENYSSIVWSTKPALAERLQQLPEEQFKLELEQAYDSKLGQILEVGPRASFPLRFLMADNYIGTSAALVGDAAHTMHPLAGQGVNLGLLDAASLAQVIIEARLSSGVINSSKMLRRYERWRKAENMSMLVMVDQIQRLFGSDVSWLKQLRNSGMHWFNRLPVIKHNTIDYAMGLHGDLPIIAKHVQIPIN